MSNIVYSKTYGQLKLNFINFFLEEGLVIHQHLSVSIIIKVETKAELEINKKAF
jgi:hypothetical protein